MLKENAATEYTARVFAILTYYKMKDDIADEGLKKKIALTPVRPILSVGAKKAAMSDIAEIIKDRLEKITALEKENTKSVDLGASLFGELLGEVFAYGLSDKDRIVTYEFGYHLGRFIYSADAFEDYDEDLKRGKYNPYVLLYGGAPLTKENRENIRCGLILECTAMEKAVDLMPFGNRRTIENIVKNIIYLGLPKRIEEKSGKSETEESEGKEEI
jgi:hypothetical protein